MRAVVQRVLESSVTVGDETVGAIGAGLLCLVGVGRDDGPKEARWLAEKIGRLRVFEDDRGKLNRSLVETGGEMLVVSQFTLWGDCRKGRRPSFVHAAPPETAETLIRVFVDTVRALDVPVAEGRFGRAMRVHLVNDGPVTLLLDTADT